MSYVDVLFGARDFKDFMTRMDLLTRVIRNDFQLVQKVLADKRVVEKARAELEKERAAQAALAREADARQQELRQRKREKDRLLEKNGNGQRAFTAGIRRNCRGIERDREAHSTEPLSLLGVDDRLGGNDLAD